MVKVCDKCRTTFDNEKDIIICDMNEGQSKFDLCEKCADKVVQFIQSQEKKGWFS